jgi:hypothetical protein
MQRPGRADRSPTAVPVIAQPPNAAPLDRTEGGAVAGPPLHRPWFRSVSWLLAWEQRRSAVRFCREMLAMHAKLGAANPGLSGRSLYRLVVAARLGLSDRDADALLLRAEQSYSIWPVERELCFRDVVHYLAVTEFATEDGDLPWVAEYTTGIVNEVIPRSL